MSQALGYISHIGDAAEVARRRVETVVEMGRRRRGVGWRAGAGLLVVGALVAGLVGCTSSSSASSTKNATTATARADVVPSPTPPVPAGQIGSAHFESADGLHAQLVISASGRVNSTGVERLDAAFRSVSGMSRGDLRLRLSPYPAGTACAGDQFGLDLGAVGTGDNTSTDVTFAIGAGDEDSADPTLYRSAVLYVPSGPAVAPLSPAPSAPTSSPTRASSTSGCRVRTLAAAAVSWSVPHPARIFALHDHGARPDASGTTVEHDGTPVSYTTGGSDSITGIAMRFGTSVNVLLFLDPTVDPPTGQLRLAPGSYLRLVPTT